MTKSRMSLFVRGIMVAVVCVVVLGIAGCMQPQSNTGSSAGTAGEAGEAGEAGGAQEAAMEEALEGEAAEEGPMALPDVAALLESEPGAILSTLENCTVIDLRDGAISAFVSSPDFAAAIESGEFFNYSEGQYEENIAQFDGEWYVEFNGQKHDVKDGSSYESELTADNLRQGIMPVGAKIYIASTDVDLTVDDLVAVADKIAPSKSMVAMVSPEGQASVYGVTGSGCAVSITAQHDSAFPSVKPLVCYAYAPGTSNAKDIASRLPELEKSVAKDGPNADWESYVR